MIFRQNWLDVRSFLDYQAEVRQSDPRTVDSYWSRLRHLISWADDKSLTKANKIYPTFPTSLEKTGRIRDGEMITATHLTAICKTCRAFFMWAKKEYPGRYKSIPDNWIETLRPSKARSEQAELKTRELFTLEDVITLTKTPGESLLDRKLRAGVALLFLSGMRIGAFVSLPISCVDLDNLRIKQLPAEGVQTKNSKAAITSMLEIPELLQVIKEWDGFVRSQLPPSFYWYANLGAFGEGLSLEMPKGKRENLIRNFGSDLRALCAKAGVTYHSPHKFRHGHAVYAIKRASNLEELKAISQNLMHSNMGITDGIYGELVEDDVNIAIKRISKRLPGGENQGGRADDDLMIIAQALLALKKNPNLVSLLQGIEVNP